MSALLSLLLFLGVATSVVHGPLTSNGAGRRPYNCDVVTWRGGAASRWCVDTAGERVVP